MSYKTWTDDELKVNGKRLKWLCEYAVSKEYGRKLSLSDIAVVTKGFETLFKLREEWKRRKQK